MQPTECNLSNINKTINSLLIYFPFSLYSFFYPFRTVSSFACAFQSAHHGLIRSLSRLSSSTCTFFYTPLQISSADSCSTIRDGLIGQAAWDQVHGCLLTIMLLSFLIAAALVSLSGKVSARGSLDFRLRESSKRAAITESSPTRLTNNVLQLQRVNASSQSAEYLRAVRAGSQVNGIYSRLEVQ